jgi:hypothetical protein
MSFITKFTNVFSSHVVCKILDDRILKISVKKLWKLKKYGLNNTCKIVLSYFALTKELALKNNIRNLVHKKNAKRIQQKIVSDQIII